MKKVLALVLLSVSITAFAQHYGHHGYWRRDGSNWGWVAPVIVGGVIGYEMARPTPPVVITQQPPVIVQQQQNCSPWTQIQNPDGSITTTRTCYNIN